MRILGAAARAIWWNALVGVVTGLVAGIVFAILMAGDEDVGDLAFVVPFLGLAIGLVYGVGAGLVHWLAQLPVLLVRPRRPRRVVRALATLVSLGLVWWLTVLNTDEPPPWQAVATFVPYVLLTPFFAAWGYVDASTAAADSAALRSGASTASRVSGSDPASSTATSE